MIMAMLFAGGIYVFVLLRSQDVTNAGGYIYLSLFLYNNQKDGQDVLKSQVLFTRDVSSMLITYSFFTFTLCFKLFLRKLTQIAGIFGGEAKGCVCMQIRPMTRGLQNLRSVAYCG